MDEIGVYEAKTRLPAILERVSKGEQFTITKHGVPVARLIPVEPSPQRPLPEVIEEMLRLRKKRKRVSMKQIIAMKNEGRR